MDRAVVVGGGVFGATAALALAERGFSVVLREAGTVPRPEAASTDISKLVRMDYGRDRLYQDHMVEALAGWEAWNARFQRPLYHPDGILVLAAGWSPGGFERDSHDTLLAAGFPVEPLALDARPAWRWGGTGYFNPRGGWAESGAVVSELIRWCREAGVEVRERTPTALHLDGARARVEGEDCDVVVLAAGSWTVRLLPALADRLRPIGQPVFHLAPADPAPFRPPAFPPWAADIANTGWYGFPADARGVVKIANHGPGEPIDPESPAAVDPSRDAPLRDFLRRHLPQLASAPVVARRLCPYCDSSDGDFLIDRHPDIEGLVISTGGSGHAFKFAPLLGQWAADAVEGRPERHGGRFGWRTPGEGRREAARSGGTRG